MENCLFCNIIQGAEPASKIYEDKETFAFLDINPTNPGHTLVVPKEHSVNLYDISKKNLSAVMETARMLAPVIKKAVGADGINIMMNNERAAGQIIDHAHVHIVPRIDDDGFRHWRGVPYTEGEMEQVAEKIRKKLK